MFGEIGTAGNRPAPAGMARAQASANNLERNPVYLASFIEATINMKDSRAPLGHRIPCGHYLMAQLESLFILEINDGLGT